MIIECNLTFRLVEKDIFKQFCRSLNPQISREVISLYKSIMDVIRSLDQAARAYAIGREELTRFI